jgi:hypothetical protein
MLVVVYGTQREAKFCEQVFHGFVIMGDDSFDAFQFFFLGDTDRLLDQFGAQALTLVEVTNQDAKAGFVKAMQFTDAGGADNSSLARFTFFLFNDKRYFAVVVTMANPGQSFVRHSLTEQNRVEKAQVNGAVREIFVKFNQ